MLLSSRFGSEAAIAIFTLPIRLTLRVVAMGGAGIYVLVVTVVGNKVTVAITAVWHSDSQVRQESKIVCYQSSGAG